MTVPFVVLGATFTKYPYMWIFEQNENSDRRAARRGIRRDCLRRDLSSAA